MYIKKDEKKITDIIKLLSWKLIFLIKEEISLAKIAMVILINKKIINVDLTSTKSRSWKFVFINSINGMRMIPIWNK